MLSYPKPSGPYEPNSQKWVTVVIVPASLELVIMSSSEMETRVKLGLSGESKGPHGKED